MQFDEGAEVNEEDNEDDLTDFLDDFKADEQNKPVLTICTNFCMLCRKKSTNTMKL